MSRFAIILPFALAVAAFGQQGNQQNTQPSNQRDRTSPPKSEAQTSATLRASKNGALGTVDRQFLTNAIRGGRMEVTLGQLAVQNAADPAVKSFGELMVSDHSKANTELEKLAQEKGLTLPAEKSDGKGKQLSNLKGEAFDRAYVRMMVSDHQKDVGEFERASRSAQDAELKSLAGKILPTLRAHLEQVKTLQQEMESSRDRSAKPAASSSSGKSAKSKAKTK